MSFLDRFRKNKKTNENRSNVVDLSTPEKAKDFFENDGNVAGRVFVLSHEEFDRTVPKENVVKKYELSNGIIHFGRDYGFSELSCNEFAKKFKSFLEEMINSNDNDEIDKINEKMIALSCEWGKKCPNDANYILAVISRDQNILSDEDIERLIRKADSLSPVDQSVYPWLVSLTASTLQNNK